MESHLKQLLDNLSKRIAKLEKDSKRQNGLCEFKGFDKLVERIEKLEKKLNNSGHG